MEQKIYLDRFRVALANESLSKAKRAVAFKGVEIGNARRVLVSVIPTMGASEEFEAAARSAKEISHLNIPELIESGFAEKQFVYVTEDFDGTTAEAWVQEHGPMPVGAVLRVALQMVSALAAAAFHGIFHHTLDPANVLITPGQTSDSAWPLIKITDLLGGLRSPAPVAPFASPEQMAGEPLNFRSAVYSLGGILWFLLTAEPPLADAATIANADDVPAPVSKLIAQMRSADPEQRPLDPVALQEQIRDCLARLENPDEIVAAPVPIEIPTVPARPFPWKPLAIAALLLATASLAALVIPRARLFAHKSEPIGIPIGVAENSPAAPAAPVAPTTQPRPNEQATRSAVLVSNANPTKDEETPPAATPPIVAANTPAPEPVAEPESPSEGPDEIAAQPTPPAPPEAATTRYANEPAPPPETTPAEAPEPASAKIAIATHTRSHESARPAHRARATLAYVPEMDGLPPLPPPVRQPEPIGTAPDGEAVFGAPAVEPGLRVRRALHVEPERHQGVRVYEGQPVLPALPPDE